MKNRTQKAETASIKQAKLAFACLLFSLVLAQVAQPLGAQAESLFRASTTYRADEPLQPRSLFTPPISRQVGDLVTILIDETTTQAANAELKITRSQTINENGSTLFNGMLGFMLDKIPVIGTKKIEKTLQAPSFNGLNNSNNMGSKAESSRTTTLKDNITCQVVQVLPSGDLVIQGQKTIQINKERGDLMVTGIIKPYYLNRNNEIPSRLVANFQMIQGGKGVISRQQNDGVANKIYQFFN